MNKRFFGYVSTALAVAVASLASAANPVTVDVTNGSPDGIATFSSIQAAITSFTPAGTNAGETAPFTINIAPSGVYNEFLTLNSAENGATARGNILGNIVIQSATPGTKVDVRLRPFLTADGAVVNTVDDGIWIYQNTNNVTFTDILFSPQLSGNVIDDLVKIDKNSDSAANTITFNGCIFTDTTDVSGVPLVTSRAAAMGAGPAANVGKLANDDTLVKVFGDLAEYMIVNFNECVFSSADCIGLNFGSIATAGGTYNVNIYKSAFTWLGDVTNTRAPLLSNGAGAQAKIITITGDDATNGPNDATVFYQNAYHAIFTSTNNTSVHEINVSDTIIYTNRNTTARGLSIDARTKVALDDVIVDTSTVNIVYAGWGTSAWSDITLHSNGAGSNAILTTTGTTTAATVNVSNAIFSGLGTKLATIAAGIIPVININNAGFPVSGPDAVGAQGAPAGFTVGPNVTTADPAYFAKDPLLATYFDVTSNAYSSAGTGALALPGGGDYVGAAPSAVGEWTLLND